MTSGAEAVPVAVTGLSDVSEIELGEGFTCARRMTGAVACWGVNGTGQLGDGTTSPRTTPTPVVGIVDATDLAVGAGHACVVISGGVRCWGRNTERQLNFGGTASQVSPVAPAGLPAGVSAVAAGGRHSCVLAGGRAYCWGNNADGQLGLGSRASVMGVQSLAVTDGVSIAASRNGVSSANHTCIQRADGTASCWGLATSGRCASGERLWLSTPTSALLPY